MKTTTNYGFKKPEKNEYINIDDLNDNMDAIDEEMAKKADAEGGDISNTLISNADEIKTEYPVPAAGDSPKTFLGKMKKFCTDIKNWMSGVCLLGQIVNNCVTDNAKLPLSAAQGKALMDLYTVLNTNTKMTIYSKQIWASELVDNAWMKVVKIGHICVAYGCFVVKNGGSVTNVDLFNISATGIKLNDHTVFSLSSFNPNGIGGIGYLEVDGRVVFALPAAGTYEWRFNFSFAEGS